MKKNTSLFIIATIITAIITNSTSAQLLSASAKPDPLLLENSFDTKEAAKQSKAASKAFKNFAARFEGIGDAKWHREQDVITARYNKDQKEAVVVYDKKGHYIRTMYTYSEDKLPTAMRKMVKRSFSGYRITSVQEIDDVVDVFIIHLESLTGYKKVSIVDGEMNVFQEFDKQ